jgi:phospholipid/cholesterol/gamma-HCH transport system permease protein
VSTQERFGTRHYKATTEFPVVARAGITLFRRITRAVRGIFIGVAERAYYLLDVIRAFGEPGTWVGETIRQMRFIGVDSVPLAVIVAGFLGAVTAFQSFYQLLPGVSYTVMGFLVRQSIVLELGPLLTALVLTGRVGARMTAEIGTMRVTEQIDALETLSYDPIAYLSLPRILASLVMLPALVLVADATSIFSAWLTLILATPVRTSDFMEGLRLGFTPFQVVYSVIKALCYGAAISFVCSYEGYVTEAGAEGVGRSTAKAVVISSVSILVFDGLIAALFAQYIQA